MGTSTDSAELGEPAAAPPPATPRKLGPYEMVREIGRGGMGVVWRARDPALKREVAIKRLHPDHQSRSNRRLRFVREAQITGRLEHPGIVPVHLLGRDAEGNDFFAMKLVEGDSLEDLLDRWHAGDEATRHDYPLARLVSLFERVCETIAFAHSHRIIHRDLKPANIAIGRHGEVWVLDWGLAKGVGTPEPPRDDTPVSIDMAVASSDTRLTVAGRALGTPEFMAPEQARGQEHDLRTDVYALGAVLFDLLAGRPPVQGRDAQDAVRRAAQGRIADLRAMRGGRALPRELVGICRRCLAFAPAQRYASARELLADVRAYLAGEPVEAAPDDAWARLRRILARHRRAAVAAASVAVALLLTVAVASALVARQARLRADALGRAQQAEALAARKGSEAEAALGQAGVAERERDSERVQRLQAELAASRALAERAAAAQRRVAAFTPYARALDLLRRGQRADRAAALADEALALDPDFIEAAFLRGEALRAQGLPREAAVAFLAADALSRRVASVPSAASLLAAALALEVAGAMGEAAAAFTAVAAAGGDDPLAEVGRALRESREFAHAAARARVDRLCVAHPHLWECHLARARVYQGMALDGAIPRAEAARHERESALRAVELAPREGMAHAQLASALGEGAESQAALDRAIALEPANGHWLARRALVKLTRGDAAGCRADAAEARRLHAAPVQLALIDVTEAVLAGDTVRNFTALSALKDQLDGWPREAMAWVYIGLVLQRPEVEPTYRALLERHPDHPYLALAQGLQRERARDYSGMAAVAERSLRTHPANDQLKLLLASARNGAHQGAQALAALEGVEVASLTPSDRIEYRRLRIIGLAFSRRLDDARAALREALAELPQHRDRFKDLEQELR